MKRAIKESLVLVLSLAGVGVAVVAVLPIWVYYAGSDIKKEFANKLSNNPELLERLNQIKDHGLPKDGALGRVISYNQSDTILLKDIIPDDIKAGKLNFILMHLRYKKTREEYDRLKDLLNHRKQDPDVGLPVICAFTHFQKSKFEDTVVDDLISYASIEEDPGKYENIHQFVLALNYKTISLRTLSQFNSLKVYNYFKGKIITAPEKADKLVLLRCVFYGNKDMYSKLRKDSELKALGLVDLFDKVK